MKERPIIFKPWEVRATLEGRKTQFCRPISDAPEEATKLRLNDRGYLESFIGDIVELPEDHDDAWLPVISVYGCEKPVRPPHGTVGDRLWVKETWGEDYTTTALVTIGNEQQTIPTATIVYKADGHRMSESGTGWRSSTHMPRWASRLLLEITGVRAIRLWDISEADALVEGAVRVQERIVRPYSVPVEYIELTHKDYFVCLWDADYAKRGYGWAENPWGWLYDYRVVEDGQ